jgi:hypothetical protein
MEMIFLKCLYALPSIIRLQTQGWQDGQGM